LAELAERRNDPVWANYDGVLQMFEQEGRVLQNVSYEMWLEEFANILQSGLKPDYDYWHRDKGVNEFSPLFRYMMGQSGDGMFGFPTWDTRVFIRAVCELTDPEAELVYDLTELVEGEEVGIDENLSSYARRQMAEDFVLNHKIVVLSEGVSDCRALEGALRLLYPHLIDYYSFMDFEGARVPGGAGALAATVKAFIGAGIVNRIVAFFDNDTAAQSAMRSLRNLVIPKNVRILRYPELEMARSYPTLGPQGTMLMDVNGLAGSIELYFGVDVLKNEDGDLTPIRSWVSIDTIYRSGGNIPEIFLRGCGVPEGFIIYMRSLTANPIQFYSCFISYSSKDHSFAERLHADLQIRGVRCWFAPEDLKIGDRFRDRIDESICLHDKLLLILSENSVSSQWVGDEVEAAFEREQRENRTVLFPIRIDDAVMDSDKAWAATIRRTRHAGDFTRWKEHDSYQKVFERLLRDLKAGA
jgi:TIR domain